MKTLLIQPPSVPEWSRHVFVYEPLALEYIGAGLKQDGHAVQLLDARFTPGSRRRSSRRSRTWWGLPRIPCMSLGCGTWRNGSRPLIRVCSSPSVDITPRSGPTISTRPRSTRWSSARGVHDARAASAATIGRPLDMIPGLALPGTKMHFSAPGVYGAWTSCRSPIVPSPPATGTLLRRVVKPWRPFRTSLGCTPGAISARMWSITNGNISRRQPEAIVEELRTIAKRTSSSV